MKEEIESSHFKLTSISKNRYKIEIKSGQTFTKEKAVKIKGCYFSGPQQAWVFPRTEENLDYFRNLFTDSNSRGDKIEMNSNSRNVKNPIKSEDILISRNYSSLGTSLSDNILSKFHELKFAQITIKSYSLALMKFFSFHSPLQPEQISKDQVRSYILYLIEERKLSSTGQNQVINALKFYYVKVLNRVIEDYYLPRPRK